MTDSSPLLIEATVAFFGLLAMAIAFWKMRRVDAVVDEKTAPVSSPPVTAPAPRALSAVPPRVLSQKERDALNEAVAAGHVFADGRPRCQAGTCQETADHAQPVVERERGVWNFLRTRFGAPDRYVLRSGTMKAAGEPTDALGQFLRTVWGGLPNAATTRPTAPKYCGTHAHVAHQVAQEKLAELEHRTMRFQAEREIDLATFEASGLDLEVRRRVGDEEARAKILREELIAAAKEARPKPERKRQGDGVVVPIRKRAAGVTSRDGAQ